MTWLVVPKSSFSYSSGTPKVLQSSPNGSREFCSDCGTPLVFVDSERPGDVDVTTGSLDEPDDFAPTVAVHEGSKLSWLGVTE